MSHFAIITFTALSGVLLLVSLDGQPPLWLFLALLSAIMFMFGWAASNMNSLSLQPLGAVAGTAASVFGFIQTVGGALMGGFVGQQFNGTVSPPQQDTLYLARSLLLVCLSPSEASSLGRAWMNPRYQGEFPPFRNARCLELFLRNFCNGLLPSHLEL